MLQFYVNNLSPSVSDTIKVDGVAFDLTGCTVRFRMRLGSSSTLKVDSAAVIVSAVDGTVRYDWASNDLDTAGEYRAWWQVTLSGGLTQDSPEFDLEIIDHAPAETTDLCSLEDVRQSMGLDPRINDMDDAIGAYISMASHRIQTEYGNFVPRETAATKRFRLNGSRAKFFPYFCTNITGVTLHPESYDQVLSASTPDWLGEPYETLDGAYTSLRISAFIPLMVSPIALRFGNPLVDVTGDWGYTTVPETVKLATIITVRSWIRRDMTTFGNQASYSGELVPQPMGTYAIPQAAREHLSVYSQVANVY